MTRPRSAVETGLQALRARDRSVAELESRLRGRGISEPEQREALELLSRLGYLDDERFATLRAATLAGRGCGDEMIRADLEQRGVAAGVVAAALSELEPERQRAERIVARKGRSAKTARLLSSRGFGADAVEALVAVEDDEAVG